MKRITLILLAVVAIIAGSVSCSKVNDIDKRLTQLEQTVSDLKAQVLAGAVITSVEKTEGGCTFTLSNGQSYIVTNGKNGTDGEAIIADVKIEDDFVILTFKDGEILCISYQNPLSMVTLSIVPDYDDGTVKEPMTTEDMGMKSTHFYLDVAVTPSKYAEILADTEKYIHKAVFSPVKTKSDFVNAFTVSPTSVTYMEGAPVPFMQTSFDLDSLTAAVLQSSAYTVSYSIEDKDGIHGAATAFVAVAVAVTNGNISDNATISIIPVKTEIYCNSCEARYTIVCKNPERYYYQKKVERNRVWNFVEDGSSDLWEVKDSAGNYVPFYETEDETEIKFVCSECGEIVGELRPDIAVMFVDAEVKCDACGTQYTILFVI